MQVIEAQGRNGKLRFNGRSITIVREGFLARSLVGGGERSIPVSEITSVDWKKAGFGLGFIRFTFAGSRETRGRVGSRPTAAQRDANAVTFVRRQQPAFEAIRAAIEAAQ